MFYGIYLDRTDCCSERLSQFYVFISDTPFTSEDPIATTEQPEVWNQYIVALEEPSITINPQRTGRYIRLQVTHDETISLAEVEVIGCKQ